MEDEAEIVVISEEDLDVHLLDVNGHEEEVKRQASSASLDSSSSTDSFSSMQDTRRRFDLSMSLDGACDVTLPQKQSSAAPPPQKPLKEAARPPPTEGLLSRLSNTLSPNAGRLSLSSIPTASPSTLQPLSKRSRNAFEDGVQEVVAEAGTTKRLKTTEVRRTISPARVAPEVVIKLEDRRASMPLLSGLNRTRRTGPPEFAPKAWRKKIGVHNNMIDLTKE